jgi:hypothetical protein
MTLLLVLPSVVSAQASGTRDNPRDLDGVLTVLKNKESTSLQRDRLTGIWYSGTVTVSDVVDRGTAERPDVRIISSAGAYWLSFATKDGAKAGQLSKEAKVRVTGRLVRFGPGDTGRYANVGGGPWGYFTDVTIAEAAGDSP